MSPHFMSDAIELQMLANNHLLKLTGIPRHTTISQFSDVMCCFGDVYLDPQQRKSSVELEHG